MVSGKRPTRWPLSLLHHLAVAYLTISWMMAFSWLLNTPGVEVVLHLV